MKLNTNYSKIKQPEGTNTFSLNVVTDLEHQGSDCNEIGNELCTQLDSTLVGQPVMLDRDRFVFFLKNNSVWVVNVTTCEATLHCQLDCFGWDNLDEELYPITGTHRIVRGCEDIVYLFNGIDRDRFINLSRPEKQQTNGFFDCSKFDFDAEIVHPTINREILNSGGNLEYGTYNFSIEFLTSNKDSIFVSPVDINYTPIIYQQEGALNLATNLPDIGGRPLSNKSIKLTITNIPEDAILARIVVFRHITGDGFTSDAHVVGNLIPVNGSTLEYIYRGFNVSNGDYLVDKNEYLTPKAIYQSSLGGIQVNNRLLRYNLKEAIRDYNNYQQKASKICTKYVVKEVDKNDPNIYLLNQTFLGGEIILPCIHWVHKDGSISNAYPLIGRTKLPNDEVLVDDILNNGQEVEKWKYFDTSIKDNTPINGYVSSGEFGYYESDQLYSGPPNYCGSNYWGEDCDGNNLEGLPVRLFVVPDRSVEPHDVGDTIRPIGIWFDENTIEFPNDDVVGYYFSIVIGQSNIEAKAIAFNQVINIDDDNPDRVDFGGDISFFDQGSLPINTLYYNLISGEFTLGQNYYNAAYTSMEGYWEHTNSFELKEFNDIFEDDLPYSNLDLREELTTADNYVGQSELNVVDYMLQVDAQSVINYQFVEHQNSSQSNAFHYLKTKALFASLENVKYLALKNDINPVPNIWNLNVRRITNLNVSFSFNGDNFIASLNVDNIPFVDGSNDGVFFWQDDSIFIIGEAIQNFYIESRYNSYLRHLGTSTCSQHSQVIVPSTLYLNKVIEPYKDKFKVKDSICPFFPGYNKDYSYVQELNRYSTIGFTFDFCSECTGLYPHRIIFSPQSFAEDLADGYRINKPNDYIDIPANTGSIVAIDYKDNKLVVRTERSCYFLQPNPQQMETSESNVYIGTGDFLSIPPQELNISQPGYGGQQHKLDSINTEKGLIWGDRQRGEMYLLGGEFKLISNDMEKWFIDELPKSRLIFGYDPLHERLMVTSNNNWTLSYCFKEQGWKSWHSYIPDWYIYNASTFYSVLENGLWEHNRGNYTTYYGLEFPHVVEMIVKSEGQTFLPQSVIYHANTYDLSNGYEQDVIGITYDQFLAYNDTQSTGFQNLILNDSRDIYWNPTSTHVKQTDRNYKISPFKDLATSSNIWTTNITPIKQNGQGYFKLLPVVDANKNMVDIGSFRSKWLGLWLISNQHQYKISLEFGDSNKQNSIR